MKTNNLQTDKTSEIEAVKRTNIPHKRKQTNRVLIQNLFINLTKFN